MVREAGGMVTDMDGENNMMNKGHLLASNLTIHKAMLQTLKS
jgi:myo-inositol-1(or 4)-monophosphatase